MNIFANSHHITCFYAFNVWIDIYHVLFLDSSTKHSLKKTTAHCKSFVIAFVQKQEDAFLEITAGVIAFQLKTAYPHKQANKQTNN